MFKLKREEPKDFYEYCYSEYFTEKYPNNYFNFYIDVGCCGTDQKWHINHMGLNNSSTLCIGFEPENNSYNLIKNECSSLSNVHIEKEFFGKNLSLKQLVEKYNLDVDKKWCFSCDCEGDEKYLFNPESIEILKKATHIAFEIHPKLANITYEQFIEYFKTYFGNTHKIIRTFHGKINGQNKPVDDNSSLFIVKHEEYNNIIQPIIGNLKYNWSHEQNCHKDKNNKLHPEHHVLLLN